MSIISGVVTTVISKRDISSRKIGLIFESIGKYAVDLALNLSTKPHKGRGRLHKTVQEEIKDHGALKPCYGSGKAVGKSGEEKMQTKIEEMQEDMSTVKHKTAVSSESMDPMSFDKLPPEHLKENDFMLRNKKRIMIRSRL